jgi:hypothetical protein
MCRSLQICCILSKLDIDLIRSSNTSIWLTFRHNAECCSLVALQNLTQTIFDVNMWMYDVVNVITQELREFSFSKKNQGNYNELMTLYVLTRWCKSVTKIYRVENFSSTNSENTVHVC